MSAKKKQQTKQNGRRAGETLATRCRLSPTEKVTFVSQRKERARASYLAFAASKRLVCHWSDICCPDQTELLEDRDCLCPCLSHSRCLVEKKIHVRVCVSPD